ncbi:oligoribonuclease [Glutamicibacter arilaitensis]|uniref:oligoribonuclease n=1 Tax=Glutamicibacter arilaitensis TaxID=256701 RepID=UPI003F8E102A
MASNSEKIVWIDCEMTGLDLVNDALIEVAVLITDSDLQIVDEGIQVVIKPEPAALAQMDDFVRNMHMVSGLLPELENGIAMDEAQRLVIDYIKKHVPEPNKALLGGNSVGTDKNFLARDMPEVIDHLHYRIIDVSTLKELSRRWFPKAHYSAPAKTGNHRALGDIQDSINELRYYRDAIMVPAPGPTSDEARKIATEISQNAG